MSLSHVFLFFLFKCCNLYFNTIIGIYWVPVCVIKNGLSHNFICVIRLATFTTNYLIDPMFCVHVLFLCLGPCTDITARVKPNNTFCKCSFSLCDFIGILIRFNNIPFNRFICSPVILHLFILSLLLLKLPLLLCFFFPASDEVFNEDLLTGDSLNPPVPGLQFQGGCHTQNGS